MKAKSEKLRHAEGADRGFNAAVKVTENSIRRKPIGAGRELRKSRRY